MVRKAQVLNMYESQLTGECGGLSHVIRNLIVRDYKSRLHWNLRWVRYTWNEQLNGWVRESFVRGIINTIRHHMWAKLALVFAAVGDCVFYAYLIIQNLA